MMMVYLFLVFFVWLSFGCLLWMSVRVLARRFGICLRIFCRRIGFWNSGMMDIILLCLWVCLLVLLLLLC